MEKHVHQAQPPRVRDDLVAKKRLVLEKRLLGLVQGVLRHQVIVGREEEPTGAARGIRDGFLGLRTHARHHRADERAGREILSRARLRVLGVFLEQSLVDVAFNVGAHRHPVRLVDHLDDPRELGGILDLVLRLREDLPEHPGLVRQLAQHGHVMHLERRALENFQRRPGETGGDADLPAVRRPAVLVRHLEEDEIGELLQVIAVADPVVAQRGAEAPDFGDDGLGGH